jgi:hypothetical protein
VTITVCQRAVYQHILTRPGRQVTTWGKTYMHTRVASDMGNLPAEQAVKEILAGLVNLGLVTVVNRRTLRIDDPIDPNRLSDDPSLTQPAPKEPVVLDPRAYGRRSDQMPELPVTGTVVPPGAAGEAPDDVQPVANTSADAATPLASAASRPVPRPPTAKPQQPVWYAHSGPSRRAKARPSTATRKRPQAGPSRAQLLEARLNKVTAERDRLVKERDAARRAAASAQAALAARPAVAASAVIVGQLGAMVMALSHELRYHQTHMATQLREATEAQSAATAMVRTLERQLERAAAEAPNRKLQREVERQKQEIGRLTAIIRNLKDGRERLSAQIRNLRTEARRYKTDADLDRIELANLIDSLEQAERELKRLRGNRTLESHPLSCGHAIVVLVDIGHNSKSALTNCYELRLLEVTR